MRQIVVDGKTWSVTVAGRHTQYGRDEVGLLFSQGTGDDREQRVLRYSPRWSRTGSMVLAELSDAELTELLRRSQPSWTSPETDYRR